MRALLVERRAVERLRALAGDHLQQLDVAGVERALVGEAEAHAADRAALADQRDGGERLEVAARQERREAAPPRLARAEEHRPPAAHRLGHRRLGGERHVRRRVGGIAEAVPVREHEVTAGGEAEHRAARAGRLRAVAQDRVGDLVGRRGGRQRGGERVQARHALDGAPALADVEDEADRTRRRRAGGGRAHEQRHARAVAAHVLDLPLAGTGLPGRRRARPRQPARQELGSRGADDPEKGVIGLDDPPLIGHDDAQDVGVEQRAEQRLVVGQPLG